MCTAMLWDPAEKAKEVEKKMKKLSHKASLLERIEKTLRKSAKMILTVLAFSPKLID